MQLTHAQNKVWRNAITLWQHAVSTNPDYHHTQYLLAKAYKNFKYYSEAESHYRAAINLNHALFKYYSELAMTYLLQGKINDAIETYQFITENKLQVLGSHRGKQPISHDLIYTRTAELLCLAGEFDKAESEIEKALNSAPDSKKARSVLNKIQLKTCDSHLSHPSI